MNKKPDNAENWSKDQELYERDYKAGYGAFTDGDPDYERNDSPAWRQGWEDAKAEHEMHVEHGDA